jgi:signal transduction histidine kinase
MRGFLSFNTAAAVVAAVVLVLAGIGLSVTFERWYEERKAEELAAQARILAATSTAALTFNDRNAATEYVNALAANEEIETAAIYDAKGILFAGFARASDQGTAKKPPATKPQLPLSGGSLQVTAPVQQGASALGTVYLEAFPDPVSRRAARYGFVALIFTMAVLVVAVLAAGQSALRRANAELEKRAEELASAIVRLESEIEERERAEEALRQAQKMEAVGQLTGGVAHDFNNLLQVITGNLDILRQRAADRSVHRLADAALRGAERAAALTQRLLAFSRRQPLDPRPIQVNKLVAGMSDMLRRTLGETVNVETVLAGGLWAAFCDANQLENALLNLAVNARDAMPDGGKLTIETANADLDAAYAATHDGVQPGQYVAIAVTDTGTGMSKDTLARVFEPFFTTKEAGRGSGLGLSQVYGFMRQSNGHVTVYSELGEGTTVRLYLPRHAGPDGEAEQDANLQPHPAAGHDQVVLVVEDDADVRANTVMMVEQLGYRVIGAADGAAALRELEGHPAIRLLFTDIGLPGGLNGRELADKARERRPGLAVLFTSGYARNAVVHHGRLDPGVEIIGKPFTFAALGARIRRLMDETSAT